MDGPGRDAEWRLPSEGKLGEMVLQAEKHQSQMAMKPIGTGQAAKGGADGQVGEGLAGEGPPAGGGWALLSGLARQ